MLGDGARLRSKMCGWSNGTAAFRYIRAGEVKKAGGLAERVRFEEPLMRCLRTRDAIIGVANGGPVQATF
jgi:hypothetical protein